jgi:hypothetical protein
VGWIFTPFQAKPLFVHGSEPAQRAKGTYACVPELHKSPGFSVCVRTAHANCMQCIPRVWPFA